MEKLNVTAETLDEVMGLDAAPIKVYEDGTVVNVFDSRPEIYMEVDKDGQSIHADDSDLHQQAAEQGWELLTGWTGQSGYRGPVMHASEYIGGRLAEYILETPGIYAAIVIETSDPDDEDAAGWAIARKL